MRIETHVSSPSNSFKRGMKLSFFCQWLWLFQYASSQNAVPRCEPLALANGRILMYIDSDTSNKSFARAVFICSEGFLPAVPTAAFCSKQMTWTPELLCRIATCNMPKKPINGRLLSITGIIYDSSVTYRCLEGYFPQDVKTSICTGSGVWAPPLTEHNCTFDAQVVREAEMEEPEPGVSSALIYVSALTSSALVLIVGMLTFGFLFSFFYNIPIFNKWKKKPKPSTEGKTVTERKPKLRIASPPAEKKTFSWCPCACCFRCFKREHEYPPKKHSIYSDDSEYTRRARARGHSVYSDNPEDYLSDYSGSERYGDSSSIAPSSRRYSRDDSSTAASSRRYSRDIEDYTTSKLGYTQAIPHSSKRLTLGLPQREERIQSPPGSKLPSRCTRSESVTSSVAASGKQYNLSQRSPSIASTLVTKSSSSQGSAPKSRKSFDTSKAAHFPKSKPARFSRPTWRHDSPQPPPQHQPKPSFPQYSPPMPQHIILPSTPYPQMGQGMTVQQPQQYPKHSQAPESKYQQPSKIQYSKPSHSPTVTSRSPSLSVQHSQGSPRSRQKEHGTMSPSNLMPQMDLDASHEDEYVTVYGYDQGEDNEFSDAMPQGDFTTTFDDYVTVYDETPIETPIMLVERQKSEASNSSAYRQTGHR